MWVAISDTPLSASEGAQRACRGFPAPQGAKGTSRRSSGLSGRFFFICSTIPVQLLTKRLAAEIRRECETGRK